MIRLHLGIRDRELGPNVHYSSDGWPRGRELGPNVHYSLSDDGKPRVQNVKSETVEDVIRSYVDGGATIMNDGVRACQSLT